MNRTISWLTVAWIAAFVCLFAWPAAADQDPGQLVLNTAVAAEAGDQEGCAAEENNGRQRLALDAEKLQAVCFYGLGPLNSRPECEVPMVSCREDLLVDGLEVSLVSIVVRW
ncbi:MAG: hypothetical protein JXO49_03475 [Deltaproteobacteria bacterium]|nr:hypothetical protein [Candidatus Anaeroferrophillus wilburensis]MBN2888388.1 hypothetical protein [Deltaproteobacteria bacterium]